MQDIFKIKFSIANWKVVTSKEMAKEDWLKGEGHWRKELENRQEIAPQLNFLSL